MSFSLPKGLSFTWLGHATFLVQAPNGKRILIDPFLSENPRTPPDKKDPGPVDLILVTHGHLDHILDAVAIAKRTGARLLSNPEIAWHFGLQGIPDSQRIEMNKGGTARLPELGVAVTMTHAIHSSGIEGAGDRHFYGGEPGGYVVTFDDGFAFYDAGDTALFSDMALISELYGPKLALLPIGDHYTMGPREAAYAARFLKSVEAVIPKHYGTFPPLVGTPAAFEAEVRKLGLATEVWTMTPGETLGEAPGG